MTRRELWNGNREDWHEWIDPEHPIRWAWSKFSERREKYPQLFAQPGYGHLDVHRLRRPRETEELLREVARRTA